MNNLGNKVALGAIWMVAMRLAIRFIGLISTLILIRLLDPHDFGIVAMVTAVVAAVETMRQFGFEVALIQDKEAGIDEYNTVWTMEIILASLAALVIVLVAKPAALFYEESEIVPLFYVIAAANMIYGFLNVGVVDFRKNLEFDREFRFLVSVKIIGFFVTVGLAYALRSFWALVIGIATTKIAGVILSYVLHPYRPRLSLRALGKLFNFSKWMFLNNVSILTRLRGPDFVIGKLAGTSGLGVFSLAFEISNLPTSELVAPINRALLPGFSKISADRRRASKAFVRVTAVIALLSLPIAFGIASTAELIGIVILGEKWLAAVSLIKVLAIFGAVTAILSPIASAIIAFGKPRIVAILSLCNAATLLPSLIFLMHSMGLNGAAIAILANSLFYLPIYFIVASRFMEILFRDIVTIFIRPTLASVMMFFAVKFVPIQTDADGVNLLLSIAFGALTYALLIALFWLPTKRLPVSGEYFVVDKSLGLLEKSPYASIAGKLRQRLFNADV